MTKLQKLILKILTGNSDQNIQFAELCSLMKTLGFEERIKGSHHIFTMEGIEEILNFQPKAGGKAKPYQVKQARDVIVKYRLGEIE